MKYLIVALMAIASVSSTPAAQDGGGETPERGGEASDSATASEQEKAVQTGSLTIQVQNLRNRRGNILVSVFTKPDGFPTRHAKALANIVIPAAKFKEAVFEDLSEGVYAVAVCHDENGSLKLETGLFGMPKEGVGVSNNVLRKKAPPKFKDASFKLSGAGKKLSVDLTYY